MRPLLILLLLAALAFAAWHYETRFPARSAADPPQTLTVAPGASVREIGRKVHASGLTRHPEVFRFLVLSKGAAGKLKAGEYEFKGEMSLSDVVDKMVRGDVVRRWVTFPEGTSLRDMAALAAGQGLPPESFMEAANDPAPIRDLDPAAKDLEGYLFPDTYDIARRPDAAATLVRRMVQRFRQVVGPELERAPRTGLTVREVVTLASLVELETAVPAERPRVAAVFLNRLRRRMPLQTDPTVIYALRLRGTWDGNIRRSDLDVDSPYNTYRYPGLPPGPIASPGLASVKAVLEPAPVADLYFVSRNDGSHHFSATLAEHQQAVDHYQRGRGAPPPLPSPAPASPSASASASPAPRR